MKKLIRTLAPPLLILLFVYAASSKLSDIAEFQGQLYNQAFPHPMADILLYTLIPAELLTAGLLCFDRTQWAGLIFSTVLLAAFSGYIALVLLHFWPEIPCSCGGILRQLGWSPHLVFNLFFLLLAIASLCTRAPKTAT
jgi:hypothetical protein